MERTVQFIAPRYTQYPLRTTPLNHNVTSVQAFLYPSWQTEKQHRLQTLNVSHLETKTDKHGGLSCSYQRNITYLSQMLCAATLCYILQTVHDHFMTETASVLNCLKVAYLCFLSGQTTQTPHGWRVTSNSFNNISWDCSSVCIHCCSPYKETHKRVYSHMQASLSWKGNVQFWIMQNYGKN